MSTHNAEVIAAQSAGVSLRTVDELAAEWHVSRWTIYRLVRDGHLHAVRVGERLRFRPDDVAKYLERQHEGP